MLLLNLSLLIDVTFSTPTGFIANDSKLPGFPFRDLWSNPAKPDNVFAVPEISW